MNRTWLAAAGLVGGCVVGGASEAGAATVGVVWSSATQGTLDGVDVTFDAGVNRTPFDLTGEDYDAAPLAANEQVAIYDGGADWTITFSAPVENLLLYGVLWRGSNPEPQIVYDFDQSFTLVDGFSGAIAVDEANGILTLPSTSFYNGVLRFDGPITSLSVDTNTNTTADQALTLGIGEPVGTVIPTPAAAALGLGLMALAGVRRRR